MKGHYLVAEIAFLKKNRNQYSIKELAMKLGRSSGAIGVKLFHLGIQKQYVMSKKAQIRKELRGIKVQRIKKLIYFPRYYLFSHLGV